MANIEDFRTNPQIVAGARTGLVAARNHKIASGLPDVALRQVLVERINQWLAAGNLDEFEDLMALAAVCDVNLIAPVVTPDQIHTGGATGTLVAHLHRLAQGIPALPDRQIALEHANAALIAADLDVMQDVLAALAALRA